MVLLDTKPKKYKEPDDVEVNWDTFRGGLNTLLRETEVDKDELTQADNLMLIGKGVPTKRWGTSDYFLSAATGSVRGLGGFYQSDGTNQLLSVTDQGLLTKRSGASYSIITGASWASGYNVEMAQLEDKMYLVGGDRELAKYSNPTISSFPTIAQPSSVFATQFSGVTGEASFSYRVSATNSVGETLASSSVLAQSCPQDLTDGAVKVTWSAVSTASNVLQGYNIYGRREGDERFLGSVDVTNTEFIDDGSALPQEFTFPQTSDSTGGVKAKHIMRFQDRLVYAGIDGEPSKVVISAGADKQDNQERNDLAAGGNFIRIEPDAGDEVTGLTSFGDKIIVFKQRSIWQITLSKITLGNFTVTLPDATLITSSHGCIAPRSIVPVENDVFFLTRKGVYALGNEPNFFDAVRTNEISAKIRTFFDNTDISNLMNAAAFYKNSIYGISVPGKNQTMIFDRERVAWMGPWTTDANVYHKYYDSSDTERLLYGADDEPQVIEYSDNYADDNGSVIETTLRTRKDDFEDWTRFKNIKEVFTQFRNVTGQLNVSIRVQERDGTTRTSKAFSVNSTLGNSGWGADMWANTLWGDSEAQGQAGDTQELTRFTILNKQARNMQLELTTNNRNDNYELLSIRARAKPLGFGFLPSDERV